jgi:lipoprotein-anchoring transpeptidase ErfK/SrfK
MNKLHAADFTRRALLLGTGALVLTGCVSARGGSMETVSRVATPPSPPVPPMYYAMPGELFPVPEVDVSRVDPKWWRTEVDYPVGESIGTIIVDTPNRYLYHVRPGGRAVRYGVGVGRSGYEWSGRGHVAYKREWPRWNPPDEMVARQPELEPVSIANGGMAPGLDNPLGARALYIHQGNRDTIYRIHGTGEFWTIGQAVSSGCIRMINQDVIHLATNVRNGSAILVIPDPAIGARRLTS